MAQGKVKFWNSEKRYGFIEREGDKNIFFHISALVDRNYTPVPGDVVEFDVMQGDRGPKAGAVEKTS